MLQKVYSKLVNEKLLLMILFIAAVTRFWKLDQVPVSLFGDELDVGYHAYSILHTGRDYMGNFMPLHFHSLAEWRTPLYLYSVVPTVAIFGISPLGVRLPAAIFGLAGVLMIYLLTHQITKQKTISLVAAFVFALSPWHIQYSRAAFEVTQLLFFLLSGLYFFFKTVNSSEKSAGKYLWIAAACIGLMPWVYNSAKLFAPIILLLLTVIWFKSLIKIERKYIIRAVIALVIVGAPMAYSIFLGGGAQRFGYVGIFTDPTLEQEVGYARSIHAWQRGEVGEGLSPTILDRLYHNKFTYWGGIIARNALESLSSDFLFSVGDPNPRHSVPGIGMFYKIEFFALLAGIVLFFSRKIDVRLKLFIAGWILLGVIPSALTRDGGQHATRLIVILPPMIFLIAYGIVKTLKILPGIWKLAVFSIYVFVYIVLFLGYQDFYWIHAPRETERWWHAGWEEAVTAVQRYEDQYDEIIISTLGEPPWTFFAAWYPYPPERWQTNNMPNTTTELDGYGTISYIDKYFFGHPEDAKDIYEYGKVVKENQLYLASADEVKINLIREPERTPSDLVLLESIPYPSGEPAFYLFTRR